jgi:hypothetical protein
MSYTQVVPNSRLQDLRSLFDITLGLEDLEGSLHILMKSATLLATFNGVYFSTTLCELLLFLPSTHRFDATSPFRCAKI